jgi:hypothetical protein
MLFTKRIGLKILTYYLAHKKDDIWKGAVAGAIAKDQVKIDRRNAGRAKPWKPKLRGVILVVISSCQKRGQKAFCCHDRSSD